MPYIFILLAITSLFSYIFWLSTEIPDGLSNIDTKWNIKKGESLVQSEFERFKVHWLLVLDCAVDKIRSFISGTIPKILAFSIYYVFMYILLFEVEPDKINELQKAAGTLSLGVFPLLFQATLHSSRLIRNKLSQTIYVMPWCGYHPKMVKGITLFAEGLFKATVNRSEEQDISIEEAFSQEIEELSSFVVALEEKNDDLREQDFDVDERMVQLVDWAETSDYFDQSE